MNAERLASMAIPGRAVALDFETALIIPGNLTPPLVCGALSWWDGTTIRGQLLDREQALDATERVLDDDSIVIVNLNIAFDFGVAANEFATRRGRDLGSKIFAAYDRGRVFDIGIAERLHAIAQGTLDRDHRTGGALRDPITGEANAGYTQAVVVDLVLGRADAKVNARWRESYAILADVPITEWPADATQYPVDDTNNALEVALAQVGVLPSMQRHEWTVEQRCAQCGVAVTDVTSGWSCYRRVPRRNLHDLASQVDAAFALHLGAIHGMRSDRRATETLDRVWHDEQAKSLGPFFAAGFLRTDVKPDGTHGKKHGTENQSVVKRAVAIAYGATGACATCRGSGKVPSPKTSKPINCEPCNGTGLDVTSAPVPMTEKGNVQAGRDILSESGDELLMAYSESSEDDKIPSTYVPFLRGGYDVPITLRPKTPLDTARVSYAGVIQLFPRQVSARLLQALRAYAAATGELMVYGPRDCFVARDGTVYYSNDYGGGELVTFSESAIHRVGWSDMGRVLNAGRDVHCALGAMMIGEDYETFFHKLKKERSKRHKDVRQAAKPGNFGFPGGMGPVRLVLQQRASGPDTPCPGGPSKVWDGRAFVDGYKGLRFCILVDGAERCGTEKVTEWKGRPTPPVCKHCVIVAERIRDAQFATFTELRPYLDWHSRNVDERGEVAQIYTGRIRGGTDFCSEANGDFQALLADVAKRAQCRVTREQYVRVRVMSDVGAPWCPNPSKYEGAESPLYGSRSIGFFHDELFGEAPESIAADVTERVNEVMVEEFRKACPHHAAACKAEPTLMRRWYKAAEPVRDESGRLVCWSPS